MREKNNYTAEIRWFKSTYSAITEKICEIVELPAESEDLGFTDKSGNISINFEHELVQNLPAAYRPMFRAGVFAHEMLHQIYTDFHYFHLKLATVAGKERKAFSLFVNVIEDPAIEHFGNQAIGGMLLKGLYYTINQIYEESPKIKKNSPDFEQLVNALIQFGDMGIIKGDLSDTALEYLKKIAPEFDAMIKEPISQKRIDAALNWTRLTKPLWENGNLDQMCENIEKSNQISETDGDNRDSIQKPEENPDDEKSQKRKSNLAVIADGDIPKGEQTDVDAADLSNDEIQTLEKILEDQLSDLEKAVNDIQNDANVKDIMSARNIPECGPEKCSETVVVPDSSCVNGYEKMLMKLNPQITMFVYSIKNLFLNDFDEVCRAKTGRYNIIRGTIGTSIKIFDRYKEKQHTSDTVVLLLVDNSGSMGQRKTQNAKLASVFLSESFAKLNLPCEIIGYSADEMEACDLFRFVSFKNTRKERISIEKMAARYNNYDGYAIRYGAMELSKRKEINKVMFVISDGLPACNHYRDIRKGINDTAEAILGARKKGITVIGIGIGIDKTTGNLFKQMYGEDFTSAKPEELHIELARKLKRIIKN